MTSADKHDQGINRGLMSLLSAILIVLFLVLYPGFGDASEGGTCKRLPTRNLVAGDKPKWRLDKKRATISVALDDFVEHPRTGRTGVAVEPTRWNKQQPQLPSHTSVGAFIPGGGLTTGERPLGFTPVTRGRRDQDGAGVGVAVCAKRRNRSDTKPGHYSGIVRVAARSTASVDVPLAITVKADRRVAVMLALLVAVVGAIGAGSNSRPAKVPAEKVSEHKVVHTTLWFMPLAIGALAGTAAGVFAYVDDPTWGANVGTDYGKAIGAAFAAATGGLTVLAPVSRGARQKIAGTT
jgi:hypothetical protein